VTDEHQPLSREVIARRELIFTQLLSVQRQRVRLRRSRLALAPLAALALVCVGSLLVHRPGTPKPQVPARSAFIEIVESAARPIRVELLTEDELVRELHALGLPCGIARFDDRVMVVSR
jgi:hypothetical protein